MMDDLFEKIFFFFIKKKRIEMKYYIDATLIMTRSVLTRRKR